MNIFIGTDIAPTGSTITVFAECNVKKLVGAALQKKLKSTNALWRQGG